MKKKIDYWVLVKGKDGEPVAERRTGEVLVIHEPDGSRKMYCAFSHLPEGWIMSELYSGLVFATGSTRNRMFDQTGALTVRFFSSLDKFLKMNYFDNYHKQLLEYYPEQLFLDHSLQDELSAYMHADTFREALEGNG